MIATFLEWLRSEVQSLTALRESFDVRPLSR